MHVVTLQPPIKRGIDGAKDGSEDVVDGQDLEAGMNKVRDQARKAASGSRTADGSKKAYSNSEFWLMSCWRKKAEFLTSLKRVACTAWVGR
jgi:hypothetical protein